MSETFAYTSDFNQNLGNWNVTNVIKHKGFASNSAIDNLTKLPEFIYNITKFHFNLDKENVTAETSWSETRTNSFIYTFKLKRTQGIPSNFKFIKFYNANISEAILATIKRVVIFLKGHY